MPASDLLLALAATAASALLLHLAARCLDDAAPGDTNGDEKGGARVHDLDAAAVVLTALALWWPLQLSPGLSLAVRGGWLPGWAAQWLPLVLAGLAWATLRVWRGPVREAAALPAAAALAAAWAWLEADPAGTPAVPALAPALAALALVGMLLPALGLHGSSRGRPVLRGAAAVAASVLLGWAAWRSSGGQFGQGSSGGDWALLGTVAALAALRVRQHHRAYDRASTGPAAARSPAVDAITGLPLRVSFEARLGTAVREHQASGSTLAVLQINLDDFRSINDAHGTQVGDLVLAAVAERLRRVARNGDAVARLSGNDFLMLVTGVADPQDVQRIAQRLVQAVGAPCDIDRKRIALSGSIGVITWPGATSPMRLIAGAELAMREARRQGGARYCVYSEALEATAAPDFELQHDLRSAIASGALELHFQPKVDTVSGKITAAEALLRWKHPTRGAISPEVFVPLAEQTGLIGPLGDWVIEEACKQAHVWRDKGLRMRVAVNLSALQVQQADIVPRIGDALRRHGIHPSLLTCEITETVAMQDTQTTQETFRQLHEMGVHVSIDDFGSGQTSLAHLQSLQVHELKIDRRFVSLLAQDIRTEVIVKALVDMAHALGLKVVAEGVETMEQRLKLVDLGCDELQGYLLARPMPASVLLLQARGNGGPNTTDFRGSLFANTREGLSRLAPLAQMDTTPGDRRASTTPDIVL